MTINPYLHVFALAYSCAMTAFAIYLAARLGRAKAGNSNTLLPFAIAENTENPIWRPHWLNRIRQRQESIAPSRPKTTAFASGILDSKSLEALRVGGASMEQKSSPAENDKSWGELIGSGNPENHDYAAGLRK